ncbi:MAG TPA: YqgE/AlgH family protein [Bacteroidetes bacterium]|nr:YqgE/AlgH family protein [Bacteroidota bacterium]
MILVTSCWKVLINFVIKVKKGMIVPFDFFSVEKKDTIPGKGKVLISEPFLRDEYFKRSIVLLAEYGNEGALGFVLNKPVNMAVSKLVKDFPEADIPVYLGGPVSTNTLHYIHTLGDLLPDSKSIFSEIYWGGDFERLKKLIEQGVATRNNLRFFIGYSGWDAGQLERELSENSWVIAKLRVNQIMMGNDQEIWKKVLRDLGKKYKLWADFPENPGLN